MGYMNPFLAYGLEKFTKDAEQAGADGLIIPDLIPEEFLNFKNAFAGSTLGVNFLISPNTPISRIKDIDELTTDFIYCVSVTGVTGCRQGVPQGLIDFLKSIRNFLGHPYLVGFGISNPKDACNIARYCHGVVVGSAITNLMAKYTAEKNRLEMVSQFVWELKSSLKGV
jgi:tryptophan synthase alpha subunit